MTGVNKNFKCDISYLKGEEGSADQKMVTENFIIKAINYTDAETKMHKFAEESSIRNFQYKLAAIKINEFIDQNFGADFWMSKTSYIVTTDSGKEKTIKETQLVNASTFDEAVRKVRDYFKTVAFTVHTRLIGLQETKILAIVE